MNTAPCWWRINLCDLPAMFLYTDPQTIADMLDSYPGLMTATPINENALPVAADGLSDYPRRLF